MLTEIPSLILNNERTMPLAGLGTYKLNDDLLISVVGLAAEAGVRLFDTAAFYRNEAALGDAIRATGIPRNEFFITTKIWNAAQRLGDARGAFARSLERLGLDYVDMYMIHWPVPACYTNTWKALEELQSEGFARSLGVSNFEIEHLEILRQSSDIVPAVNQIEMHPLWDRAELVRYCREHGIAVQAYAPLARGAYLDRETLIQIGQKYGKSSAQIGLRYLVQQGISVIPRASDAVHLTSNLDIFDFDLSEIDMQMIQAMNEKFRSAQIPEDLRDIDF